MDPFNGNNYNNPYLYWGEFDQNDVGDSLENSNLDVFSLDEEDSLLIPDSLPRFALGHSYSPHIEQQPDQNILTTPPPTNPNTSSHFRGLNVEQNNNITLPIPTQHQYPVSLNIASSSTWHQILTQCDLGLSYQMTPEQFRASDYYPKEEDDRPYTRERRIKGRNAIEQVLADYPKSAERLHSRFYRLIFFGSLLKDSPHEFIQTYKACSHIGHNGPKQDRRFMMQIKNNIDWIVKDFGLYCAFPCCWNGVDSVGTVLGELYSEIKPIPSHFRNWSHYYTQQGSKNLKRLFEIVLEKRPEDIGCFSFLGYRSSALFGEKAKSFSKLFENIVDKLKPKGLEANHFPKKVLTEADLCDYAFLRDIYVKFVDGNRKWSTKYNLINEKLNILFNSKPWSPSKSYVICNEYSHEYNEQVIEFSPSLFLLNEIENMDEVIPERVVNITKWIVEFNYKSSQIDQSSIKMVVWGNQIESINIGRLVQILLPCIEKQGYNEFHFYYLLGFLFNRNPSYKDTKIFPVIRLVYEMINTLLIHHPDFRQPTPQQVTSIKSISSLESQNSLTGVPTGRSTEDYSYEPPPIESQRDIPTAPNSLFSSLFNVESELIGNSAPAIADIEKYRINAKRLLTSLSKELSKEWFMNSSVRGAFLTSYSKRYPQNCGDLSDRNLLGSQYDSIKAPLLRFLEKNNQSMEAQLVVSTVMNHFQIYYSQQGINQISQVPLRNVPVQVNNESTVCELLGPTLYQLVREDFNRLVGNPDLFLARTEPDPILYQPLCIVVDQDGPQAKAFAIVLGLDKDLMLRSVANNCAAKASNLFRSIGGTEIMTSNQWGVTEATLSLEQLDLLNSKIRDSAPNTLFVLNLKRETISQRVEEINPPPLQLEDNDRLPEETSNDESDQLSDDLEFSEKNETSFRHVEKRNREKKNTTANSKKQRAHPSAPGGIEERSYQKERNVFNPLTLLKSQKQNSPVTKATGPLPTGGAQHNAVQDNEISLEEIDLDNPWLGRSLNTLNILKMNLSKEQMRRNALQGKPLNYPIINELAKANTRQVLPPGRLHPSIKLYQENMVNEWLRLRGTASPIIAAEPGLGKTWIACEILIRVLLEHYKDGIAFFLGPVSTVNQSCERIQNYLLDLYGLSWKTRDSLYQQNTLNDPAFLADFQNELSTYVTDPNTLPYERWIRLLPILNKYWDQLVQTQGFLSWVHHHERKIQELNLQVVQQYQTLTKSLPINTQGTLRDRVRNAAVLAEGWLLPKGNPTLSLDHAKKLGCWPIPQVVSCPTRESLKKKCNSLNSSTHPGGVQIIVSSPQAFTNIPTSSFPTQVTPMVILDEAQNAHNDKSVVNSLLKERISHLRKRGDVNFLLMTGTPLENNIAELWTLMNLAHSDHLFPSETQQALANCLSIVETGLRDMTIKVDSTPGQLKVDMLNAFAHLHIFSHFARQLVLTLKMDSEEVKNGWENRLPEKKVKFKACELDEESKNKILTSFRCVKKGSALCQHHDVAKVLLGVTHLISNHPEAQDHINDIIHERKPIEAIVREIPILSILTQKGFKNGIENKQPLVIATDHIVSTDIIHAFVKKIFQTSRPGEENLVLKLTGELSPEQRKKAGKLLEQKRGVLVMTAQAGGEGLDLPFAHKLIDVTCGGWNPGAKEQLWGRISRVGHPGKRTVYVPQYGIPQEQHFKALRDGKELLKDFVFGNTSQTLKDHLKLFGEYLKAGIYKELLNRSREKELPDFNQRKETVDNFISAVCADANEIDLQTLIDAVTPKVPVEIEQIPLIAVAASSYETITFAESQFFMVPLPSNWSREKRLSIGRYAMQNLETIKEDIYFINWAQNQEKSSRQNVRRGIGAGRAKDIIDHLERWEKNYEKSELPQRELPHLDFKFEGGEYHARLPSDGFVMGQMVCFYRSIRPCATGTMQEHFDLLIPISTGIIPKRLPKTAQGIENHSS